ncbi:carbohydrate ABC transporter permease [Ensifer sp. ENS11]|uniref:carbohydrate ABC transporter permease n=1 Tax=Ensifer sp. ENS11 TaxID=2769291 RepID=UPI001FEF1F71|nr:sugar ABC transporter permease [Ensifer sp. ENS11]
MQARHQVVPNSWVRARRALTPWLFLLPALIMFAVYVVVPIGQSIVIGFYEWDGFTAPIWIGLDNYTELFSDEVFYVSLKNNLLWLTLYLLAVPVGLALAIFLNQTVTGIRLYKSLFFLPFIISQVVVGLIFSWFYAPGFGPVAGAIKALTGVEIAILADERFATLGIIAAGLWPQTAYCMILFLSGLNNINPEQVEAARIDNAKGLKMLWHIILPQLRPATFMALVVTIIGSLRSFDLVSIMTSGGPYGSTRVLSFFMYEQALSEYGYRMGYGAAISVILFAIMMIFISIIIYRMLMQERAG